MSEAEIIESLFSIYDRYWTIVQWWSSVSFSLIIVAYLAADRLNKGIVTTLLGLYTLYTVWVYLLMAYCVVRPKARRNVALQIWTVIRSPP